MRENERALGIIIMKPSAKGIETSTIDFISLV
jgi:hypothetical protein